MVLTQKQRDELNKGIIEYLYNNSYESVAEKFEQEIGIQYDQNEQKNSSMKNILEKKWVSIIRLQKRDIELKQEIEDLKAEIENLKKGKLGGGGISQSNSKNDLYIPKVKHTLSSHRGNITRVAFHKQYSWCASSSQDGSVKVWDADTGELEATLKQHAGIVNSIAFDYSGKYLVSASSDMTLKIWDLQQFLCVKTLQGHDHSVSHGEFSLDNNYILSCSRDQTIKIWEVNSGYCKKTLDGHSDWVRFVKISQNGQKFASCGNDQMIIIWNYATMEPIQTIEGAHDNVIEILAWCGQNMDKSEILKGTNNSTNSQSKPQENSNESSSLKGQTTTSQQQSKVNKDEQSSQYLASGARDNKVKLWDTLTGQLLFTFIGNDNWIRGIGFHPYLNYMYTCSDDRSIRVWNTNTGKQVRKFHEAHSHFISSLDIANNYTLVATGGFDFKIKIWDLTP